MFFCAVKAHSLIQRILVTPELSYWPLNFKCFTFYNKKNIKRYFAWNAQFKVLKLQTDFSQNIHCLKSVQMRSYFWSVFSRIRTKYGDLRSKSPYSVRMQENKDQKKLRIWTLFTQYHLQLPSETTIAIELLY